MVNFMQYSPPTYVELKSRVKGKKLQCQFNQELLSSDGGIALFNEIEERSQIIKTASKFIKDDRVQGRSKFSIEQMLKSRIYPIGCGYEDANDLMPLKHDCVFKESLGINPISEQGLPSQPTASRFENSFKTREEVAQFSLVLPHIYTRLAYKKPPRQITLDLDETFMPCHGTQQDSLFSGHESKYGYKPLFVIDAFINCALGLSDRAARTLSGKEIKELFEPIYNELRKAWPEVKIVLRGDSHYGRDEFLKWCEETEGVTYITGFTRNNRLETHPAVEKAKARNVRKFLRIEEKEKNSNKKKTTEVREHCTFRYSAESWDQDRKMVACIRTYRSGGEIKTGVRFIVTSIETNYSPKHLYKNIYAKRGQAENIIKDIKRYLKGNRQSCRTFLANQVRLILHGLSHWFFVMMSRLIPKNSKYKKKSIPGLQMLLIKIAVQMNVRARTIQVMFSCSTPAKDLFLKMIDSIHKDSVYLGP